MLPFFALTGIQLQAIKDEMQYMLQTETFSYRLKNLGTSTYSNPFVMDVQETLVAPMGIFTF